MVNRKILSLVFVRESTKILLGYKKRGFGQGRWNGFGGKVEQGETIEEGAMRELQEEAGVLSHDLSKIGLLEFEFVGDPTILQVHVFTTTSYNGLPTESDEMKPQWFEIDRVPFNEMWPDDFLWFPLMLKGAKFQGYFLFHGHHNILKYNLEEVERFKY